MAERLRVLESFVNVGSSVVRCLALAVLRQHVAVALALAVTLVASLTRLISVARPHAASPSQRQYFISTYTRRPT